jgi:hypothetical protein
MSESLLNRTYTPPTEGTFDPYTAGITGNIPSFYTYAPARPATPPQTPQGPVESGYTGDGGGAAGEGGLTGLGPNPGSLDRNFGQTAYGSLGRVAGTVLGGTVGGLGLGALGTYADVRGLNADLAMMGLPQEVSFPSALASNLSYGILGTPAAAQFGNIIGYDAFAEAPLSAFSGNNASKGLGETDSTTGPTPGDKGESIGGGEKGDPGGEAQASESGGDMGGEAHKQGGLIKLAGGGLVPLAGGGKIAIGPGGGLDDLIPTSIEGRRAAALSDGEFVIPADVVSMMGDGSSNAGARRLYDLVRQVRDAKTGTTRQAGPLPVGEILKRSMN